MRHPCVRSDRGVLAHVRVMALATWIIGPNTRPSDWEMAGAGAERTTG